MLLLRDYDPQDEAEDLTTNRIKKELNLTYLHDDASIIKEMSLSSLAPASPLPSHSALHTISSTTPTARAHTAVTTARHDLTSATTYKRNSVCVECYFEGHGAEPLAGLLQRAPKGRPTRTPPPVVPDPESIDAQAAYRCRHSTIAQVGSGPNCFQALVTVSQA